MATVTILTTTDLDVVSKQRQFVISLVEQNFTKRKINGNTI